MKNWNYIEGAKTGNAGITDKEFNSENEMRRWCIEHNYTYTPVGGGYYRLEDDSGKNRKDLEAHVKAGNKTGNDTPWEYAHRKPKVINEDKTGAEEFFKHLSDDVKEREEKDDADIEKVGNALNWDENLVGKFVWVKDKGQEWKVYVMQDKGDKVYIRDDDGSQGWVSKTRITGKVGNRIIEKESEMSQELKNLLKKAPEWIKEKIQYAFSHGFTIDEKDFINAIKKEVGNSKTGNIQYHKVGKITIKLEANDDDWTVYDNNGNELKSGKGGLGRAKTWAEHFARFTNKKAGNSKWGNSASDDKFAYVMREFDAGKLKTPDGKVVTDPAQAKAIAYSESKKTENGLARARNAMNKRCGNSQVTLWKGNDSVLISEDGTVQYLESNSFETDRDKYGSMQEAIDDLTKKGYRKK